ncbi:MAG: hypothetical protein CMK59_13150 [Proteobacteria bacterium]|nr:hypothetical protein [Pseudomonadota bacterium]
MAMEQHKNPTASILCTYTSANATHPIHEEHQKDQKRYQYANTHSDSHLVTGCAQTTSTSKSTSIQMRQQEHIVPNLTTSFAKCVSAHCFP